MKHVFLLAFLVGLVSTFGYSQKKRVLKTRNLTTAIKPYFERKQFIDSEIYQWGGNNKAEIAGDYKSVEKGVEFRTDSFAMERFTEIFYCTYEKRMPLANVKFFYRFLWQASMDPERYIITVFKKKGRVVIETKNLTLGIITSKSVSEEKLKELEQLLENNHFWEIKPGIQNAGFDGSDWLLEGQKERLYHFAYRWSPHEDSALYKIGTWFIKNGDVKSPIIY